MANSRGAAGATFADVVQMQTFHNCNTPNFQGDLDAQAGPIIEVKKEFMPGPLLRLDRRVCRAPLQP